MEEVVMTKNSKKYGFEKGAKFNVLRNVSGECVVMSSSGLNIIMSEKRLRSYGKLTGRPQIGI